VLTILRQPIGIMPWNTDEFADLLQRACRPDSVEARSAPRQPAPSDATRVRALLQPPPRDTARALVVPRQPAASLNPAYGFAALLILGAAVWLALPRLQPSHQASVAEIALADPVPSQTVGHLALPALPETAEPPADAQRSTAAPGFGADAEPRRVAADANRIDPHSLRFGEFAPRRVPSRRPPLAPSAEPTPTVEPKLVTAAEPLPEPLPAAETKLAALAPSAQAPRDEPAWLRFAVPAAPAEGRPRIAVVIDDLGLDKKRTERTLVLPGPLTLSFLAYAADLPKLSDAAKRAGHELLVSVPMEPISRAEDMGPNGLTVGLTHDEMLRRLRWNLDRFDGYVGINNHMGSRFTHDAASMTPVMEELRARGLLFLDARTVGNSTGVDVARRLGVPNAARDVFLDNEVNAAAIAGQLAEVERIARRHGSAVAIGHARDATIEQLDAWLASLPGKGFALVPVSTIVREHWHGGGETN
jgi:hypothetical protein